MGRAVSVVSRLAARCWREKFSLMHSFVAMISDSSELREVRGFQRYLQEKGPLHQVMMWPDME